MSSVSNLDISRKIRPNTAMIRSSSAPKFGLFSYVGSQSGTAVPAKPFRKRPDGSVETAPKNITSSKSRSYFSHFSSCNVGAPYQNKENPLKGESRKKEKMLEVHDNVWVSGLKSTSDLFGTYEHMPMDKPKVYNRRIAKGKVTTEPRNMRVAPMKKGHAYSTPGLTISRQAPHMNEPYDLQTKLSRIQNRKTRPTTPFRPSSKGSNCFFDDKTTYGGDVRIKQRREMPRPYEGYDHDMPYVTTSAGNHGNTFSSFEYLPQSSETAVIPKRRTANKRKPWRPTYNKQTGVSPSISQSTINLKREFASIKRISKL